MSGLSQDMRDLVARNSLGFVATVNADGTPNLSPKGTCVVLDENHLAFGEIRSPRTLANLRERPAMAINFVDFLSRRGFRASGRATFVERASVEFADLMVHFAGWDELCERINAVVRLQIEQASPLTSPAYDLGATEDELRAHWRQHFLA